MQVKLITPHVFINNAADKNKPHPPVPTIIYWSKEGIKKLASINTTCTSLPILYIITAQSHKRNVGIPLQNCNEFLLYNVECFGLEIR